MTDSENPETIPSRTSSSAPPFDARRSNGEAELLSLSEQPLLPPNEEAYSPDPAALEWRSQQLLTG